MNLFLCLIIHALILTFLNCFPFCLHLYHTFGHLFIYFSSFSLFFSWSLIPMMEEQAILHTLCLRVTASVSSIVKAIYSNKHLPHTAKLTSSFQERNLKNKYRNILHNKDNTDGFSPFHVYLFIFLGHAVKLVGSYFPDQVSNLGPSMKASNPNH